MSIFYLVCGALSGESAAPNVIEIPDGVTSEAYSEATAGISFNNNGSYALYYNGVPIVDGYWITPQTNISEYEIYATLDSGDTPTGTFSSWLPLSTSRSWTLASTSPSGILTSEITFKIRWTGNNEEQDTGVVTLYASDSAPA